MKRNSHLCSRFKKEADVLKKVWKAAGKQGEREKKALLKTTKK
ncbi:hypothetical protein ACFFGT_20785 [Mucilaginibacter angelicae]|uniref:Uncharacterized protein n=1 Tax=Mucilaginibacter angelicae TaxID=869718 RepID=A0ABV6LB15_9SPHI